MEKWKDKTEYKKVHEEGYYNSIFSTEPIEMGKEKRYNLKNDFSKPEPVYARCYLPGPVGKVEGKNFLHELWIDGKLAKTTRFNTPPEPDWDQIQVWISEDEYKNEIASLESGQHDIILWVIKKEFKGMEKVVEKDFSGNQISKEREVWASNRLSKGKFSYIV